MVGGLVLRCAVAGCIHSAARAQFYPHEGAPVLVNWIAELKFASDHQWRREDWNRAGRDECEAIAAKYRTIAGFDKETVNSRPSIVSC